MLDQIRTLARQYSQTYIDIRRHLHQHPEMSYEEYQTSVYIREHLTQIGIPFAVMAGTGVVGMIEGRNPESRVLALRADMDALPITEKNEVPYKSKMEGLMHACGHDVHSSCLLGAARILFELRHHWEGTVKLVFQPGEERNPGGASLMIKEGVLENPAPQKIFALHVHPGLETGKFSFRGGKVMASADELYITVKARGGHAAAPHFTADSILAASQIVVALQQLVSRRSNPFDPSVLSITSIQGGHTTNVLPSEVKMMGTFRAMDETWRFKAHDMIQQIVKDTALAYGAEAEARIDVGYPFVWNDPDLSEQAMTLAKLYAGQDQVEETELRMGAEDFAFYAHRIPACFFRLGTGNVAKGITHNVHTPHFDIDEQAIENGMGMMAWLAVSA
ncbi:MAG TPA: M20 family metallopeptidase [Ferruginibacter sp.]|nr:M20 family metallopeptidase [Ferruginibacter sp.]